MSTSTPRVPAPSVPGSFVEKFVVAGGYATRYLEGGDSSQSTILLLHDGAWGGSSDVTWGHMFEDLAAHHHVLAPDQLGLGGSDKVVFTDRPSHSYRIDHTAAFLAAVGVDEPVHVVGNSFGGTLGLRALPTMAIRSRSVTSIAGGGGPWRTPTSKGLAAWDGTRKSMRDVLRLLIDDFPGFDEQLERRMYWASRPGHYRAVSAVGVPLPTSLSRKSEDTWPRELSGVDVPVQLIRGRRDELLQADWPYLVAAELSRAEVLELDCKHAPNIDNPKTLLPEVLGFLERVERDE